jgi:hypothetical protein
VSRLNFDSGTKGPARRRESWIRARPGDDLFITAFLPGAALLATTAVVKSGMNRAHLIARRLFYCALSEGWGWGLKRDSFMMIYL